LFDRSFEAFAAYGIHRKERKCLCEWYTIGSGMKECVQWPWPQETRKIVTKYCDHLGKPP